MGDKEDVWTRTALELEESVRRALGGPQVVMTLGPVRGAPVRGTPRTGTDADVSRVPVVVVVGRDGARPPEADIARRLRDETRRDVQRLDLYVVMLGKHAAAMEPRELDPEGEDSAADDRALLRNLRPEFVLVPRGAARPSWCATELPLIEW